MDEETLHHPEDDFTTVDASMMSSTSPYQSTTEPVAHRRSFIGGLVIEMRFVKSLPGIFKTIEVLFGIAVAISAGASTNCNPCGPITFMQFVSISAIIITCILYGVFVFSLHNKTDIINWPLTDLGNSALFFVLYLISSSVLVANANSSALKSATAFGYMCAILYGASTWFAYKVFIFEYRKQKSTISHIKGVADKMETEELS